MEISPYGARAAAEAATAIRRKVGEGELPVLGIVLGSGLGGLVRRVEDARAVPFADVPGFPPATVVGPAGRVIVGRRAGRHIAPEKMALR